MEPANTGPTWTIGLGSGALMPAVLLGYETTLTPGHPAWDRFGVAARFLFVDQQAGGYRMTTMSCVGFLFRLEANADLAMSDPTPLVTAFRAMAEDPRPTDVAANEPRLLRACGTWGEDLPATVLSEISEAVRERYDLPECESGFEAFVRLRADRPGRMLGWRYVEPTGASSGIGEDWPSSSPQWRDGPRLVADDLRELRHLGNILLNAAEDARLFLLWENSD